MEILKEQLSRISAGKVLDVGTGRGEFVEILATFLKGYTEIIGIDTNNKAIEGAAKNFNNKKIKFINMNAENLEFEDESFDTVCISNSLHHLPKPEIILDEMKRVLKPGGRLIIAEMFCDNQNEKQLNHVAWHHWAAEINRIMGVFHNNTYKKQDILELADSMDFTKIDIYEFVFSEDDSLSEEELKGFFKCLDDLLDKVKDHPDYDRLYKEKEFFQKNIRKIGMGSATELLVIGYK